MNLGRHHCVRISYKFMLDIDDGIWMSVFFGTGVQTDENTSFGLDLEKV